MSWATENSIVINGTPQVGDNSISLTYYFDPANVPGICCYAPTLKVKCVTDNNWDEKWLDLGDISSGTTTITLNELGSFQAGKEYAICYAYFNGSWVDDVFQSVSFPAAPAPAVIDLSTITTDYVIPDGATLTGTLQNNVVLSVADNATITLSNVDINWNKTWTGGDHAGITCDNATIILAECTTNKIRGFLDGNPGVYVRQNKTITIQGTGTLYAATNGGAAAIGSGYGAQNSSARYGGNIVINGGTIYATGGVLAAGIGAGGRARIGNITINGGIICANAGSASAGIGCGQTKNNSEKSQCGNITISANVTYLKATKASDAAHSIGKGSNSSTALCGTVTVAGATGYKSANPFIYSPAADNVKNLINAIGSVAYTQACKDKIDAARAAYEALADYSCDVDAVNALKGAVSNYSTLTAAEAAYNTLAANAVIDKINAIGSPITAADQAAIEDARAAYNALTGDQQALVGNYATLTDAEAALAVVNLINAISSPITAADQTAIEDARNAYNALTGDQQALVGNYATLTDAEAALAVVNLINAIDDPVVYTDACHQEILDARTAYDALSDEQKALVDATKLTDAEDAYASLNVDITAKLDPVNAGVYYSTFYDGSRQLQLPANVEAYTATVSGDKMLLKKVAVPGDILPAATAVVLRASQADFSLTPSAASPVSVENNALRGTDVNMEVPSEHCYVLSGADGFVGFYPLSAPYTLSAHKAYIDLDNLPGGANNAPRRLRFVFSEEQTTTGMENVQNEETKAQKVMIDGVMYIIRGEHMYDAQGRIVK